MPAITNFSLSLNTLNDSGTFSEGDTVSGKVSLELTQSIKILSLSVKATGDVDTKWKELVSGELSWTFSRLQVSVLPGYAFGYTQTFRRHERMFKEKEVVISEQSKTTLPPGLHEFPFSIQVPSNPMPSSFRSTYGSVVYNLEATLRQRVKKARKVQQEISFRSKSVLMPSSPGKSQTKRHKVHGSDTQMELSVDRKVYSPGNEILVTAKIRNNSKMDLEPIFILKRMEVYRSRYHKKIEVNCLQTVFKDVVKSGSQRNEACVMQVPADAALTVDHSEVLSVHFSVQMSLDALPAFMEDELPVVIVPRDALTSV